MNKISHIDKNGNIKMVDISDKEESERYAKARCSVSLSNNAYKQLKNFEMKKGDVLTTAKLAGIQAAKRTSSLIPLCHQIFITDIDLHFEYIQWNLLSALLK